MESTDRNGSERVPAQGNVVLLTIDTLRADALGYYGGRLGLSPFIDSLAARAVRYVRAQAAGPYTQASFPAILTSSYYLDRDDHGKGRTLSSERLLVSEPLRSSGVATAAFHSNPYLCSLFGWNRGWDVFYDSMQEQVSDEVPFVPAGEINRKADAWLAGRAAAGGRFFLWVHYMDMHEPYVPAQKYLDAVDPELRLSPQEMFGLFKNTLLARDVSDPARVGVLRKLYLANLRKVDECVRDFFAILDRHGLAGRTAVILTSDHGDEFREHGGLSHDGKVYSELLHVPLMIVDGPGGGGATCDALVGGADIPPTILELFGLPAQAKFQGSSLLSAGSAASRGCFSEGMGKCGRRKETDRPVGCYREGDLRIGHRLEGDRWELYDLASDPAEKRNLMDSSPRADELQARLTARMERRT